MTTCTHIFHICPLISSHFPHISKRFNIFLQIFHIFPCIGCILGKCSKFFQVPTFKRGEVRCSKLPILEGGVEIMGHFPEYDIIRGALKILKFVCVQTGSEDMKHVKLSLASARYACFGTSKTLPVELSI